MNILALDLGTKTGWALWRDGLVLSGVQDFSLKRGDGKGMRFVYFERWMADMLAGVTLVAWEQAHNRGGAATEILNGFVCYTKALCDVRNIPYTSVHSATLKKHATGSGRADKAKMIGAAGDRWAGQDIADDNQADALCLLDYALKEIVPIPEVREGSET